jgi:nicotinate phosphoribosyltransferase
MNKKSAILNISALYTDLYQLTMAQAYFKSGMQNQTAIFDYFFRKIPSKGGYVVFAGLENLLEILEDFKFTETDLKFLKENDFDNDFLDYLKDFKFSGNIFSSKEGDFVFPTRPVLYVEANIIEAQIIESLLLNILNYQSLIATKASRIRHSAADGILLDFGMRRAHALASYHASRAAIIGGFDGSSNTLSAKDFSFSASGTMAHSFVQSFDNEIDAFRAFANARPDDCVLLVDTYDSLKSGLPNAIKVAKEMEAKNKKLKGIRLDSGDLAYLSKQSRKMLDKNGLEYVKIAASNQLDEYIIKSLQEQNAPIDVFGVGTALVTAKPDAALDGVYKLAFSNNKSSIKLSENSEKITLPDKKQVYRLYKNNGELLGADIITLENEKELSKMYHPFDPLKSIEINSCNKEALLHKVMENGNRTEKAKTVQEIANYSKSRLNKLSEEYKRFDFPHIYKIGISEKLKQKRDSLIKEHLKS